MRTRRHAVALLALAAWTFAGGCRTERRAPAPARGVKGDSGVLVVVVTADTMRLDYDTTMVATVTTVTDTTGGAAPDTTADRREPGDRCRYADARRQARPGDANYGARYDTTAMSRGVTLRCALREGGPEVRLVVLGSHGIPMAIDVYLPATAARATQRLFTQDNDEGATEGSGLAYGEDLNRDGWTDIKLKTWSGSGGIFYDVFMYEPRRGRFVVDSVLKGGGGVVPLEGDEPCVITSHRSGVGNWTSHYYCWRGAGWELVRQRRQESLRDESGPRYVLTVRVPRGGRLVTVSADTSDVDDATRARP
ncbi:MAG TPA: hypothetical protein VEX86_06680 [Longimicrobium sp.]|nr:hypothetical protein [Longimicrobium sp.]